VPTSFEATVRVAARKWRDTRDSSWAVIAGLLIVAIGLVTGVVDRFNAGAVVLICIGIFVTAVAIVVRSIRR